MKTITTTRKVVVVLLKQPDSLYLRTTASRFPQPIEEALGPHIIVAISDSAVILQ